MSKAVTVLAVLFLAAALAQPAGAGAIKYIMVKHYDDGKYAEVRTKLPESALNQVFQELKGADGKKALEDAGAKRLAALYHDLTTDDGQLWRLETIASLNESDVHVYLVCDQEGLTPAMAFEAGLCRYCDPSGLNKKEYAMLCAHSTPERALKIGEHFAQELVQQMQKRTYMHTVNFDADQALAKAVGGTMVHTYTTPHMEFQPNDFLYELDAATLLFKENVEKAGFFRIYQKPVGTLLLMPTRALALFRSVEIVLTMGWNHPWKEAYGQFYLGKAHFIAEDTHWMVQSGKIATRLNDAGYNMIAYTDTTLDALLYNDVFGALFLFHIVATQPRMAAGADAGDSTMAPFPTAGSGVNQLLEYLKKFDLEKDVPGAAAALMDNAAATLKPGQMRTRRLYVIALFDALARFRGTRAEIDACLVPRVIPSAESKALLDEYFGVLGTDGLREKVRKDMGEEVQWLERFVSLSARFGQGKWE